MALNTCSVNYSSLWDPISSRPLPETINHFQRLFSLSCHLALVYAISQSCRGIIVTIVTLT